MRRVCVAITLAMSRFTSTSDGISTGNKGVKLYKIVSEKLKLNLRYPIFRKRIDDYAKDGRPGAV